MTTRKRAKRMKPFEAHIGIERRGKCSVLFKSYTQGGEARCREKIGELLRKFPADADAKGLTVKDFRIARVLVTEAPTRKARK